MSIKSGDRGNEKKAENLYDSLKIGVSPGPFKILNVYARQTDGTSIDGQLKHMKATEELKLSGRINVSSVVDTTKEPLCCTYSEDYDQFAVGFTDGMLRLFKSATAQLTNTLCDTELESSPSPITSVKHRIPSSKYPPTESVTCTYANGWVKSWNYKYSQCMYTIREKRQTLGLTYHPRLPKFLTCGDDNKIYLYDEEAKTQERILSSSDTPGMVDGHNSRVFTCCFNPRSNHEFVSGGWDDIVYFWDVRQAHAVRHISGVHICGDGIDICPKGNELLTAAWQKENQLQVWDYGSGKLIQSIEGDVNPSQLYCARLATSMNYILCGGSDPHIFRVVDHRIFATVASITGFPGGVFSFDLGERRKEPRDETKRDITILPKLVLCSGKKIYQIDFSI